MIEGLRTDSLYLGNTDIRVSQLLALICFGAAIIILLKIFVDKRGNFPPLAVELMSAEEIDDLDDELDEEDTDIQDNTIDEDTVTTVSNENKE